MSRKSVLVDLMMRHLDVNLANDKALPLIGRLFVLCKASDSSLEENYTHVDGEAAIHAHVRSVATPWKHVGPA